MLAKRAASAAVIIIFGFLLVLAGGWIYTIGVALILSIAAWEYASMFRKGGYFPAMPIWSLPALSSPRSPANLKTPEFVLLAVGLFILAVIAWHILTFSSHPQTAGIDLAVSLSAVLSLPSWGLTSCGCASCRTGFTGC